jgi:hypothetical protein
MSCPLNPKMLRKLKRNGQKSKKNEMRTEIANFLVLIDADRHKHDSRS